MADERHGRNPVSSQFREDELHSEPDHSGLQVANRRWESADRIEGRSGFQAHPGPSPNGITITEGRL